MNSHRFSRSLVYFSVAVVALVLLLPAAAQAQTPGKPKITIASGTNQVAGTDAGDVQISEIGAGLTRAGINFWHVSYTDTSGDEKTAVVAMAAIAAGFGSDREGLWKARYRGCRGEAPAVMPDDDSDAISDTNCEGTGWSPEVVYSHGPPPAPTRLEALPAVQGDAITLTWSKAGDTGVAFNEHRYRMSGADEFGAWETAMSPKRVTMLTAGTTYMFEVRSVGKTTRRSNGEKADKTGPAAMITAAAGGDPVPTLSEVGVLLLGLMLIGGGVYYTRRRQTVPQLTA